MSKKHHYVPRGLLKNFAAGRKRDQVHVFDKVKQSAYQSNLTEAGSENYFNTLTLDGRAISFEDAFDRCDDQLARLARRLVERRTLASLTSSDRREFAYLAALQYLRVKIIRTSLLGLPGMLREAILSRGGAISPELEKELAEPSDNEVKFASLQLLKTAPDLAKHFTQKDWSLLTASEADTFFTSDNPVVIANVFPYGECGLASPGVEICWPLGSQVAILFQCPSISAMVESKAPTFASMLRSNPSLPCTQEHMDYYNSLQVFQSSRFLYGPTNEFRIARRAMKDHPTLSQSRTSIMTVDSLSSMPSKRSMPMGQWLVVFGAKTHYMCQLESADTVETGFCVTIAAESMATMLDALRDGPYSRVLAYQDQRPRLSLGNARIERMPGQERAFTVEPSDTGIRQVFKNMSKPVQRDEDDAGNE